MRTRILFGCGLVLLVVAGLLWFFPPTPPRHNINADGYHKIELGMTEQEVESVLGVPAGDYGPGKGEILDDGVFTVTSYSIITDPNGNKWLADSFAITVCFDDGGLVSGKGTDEVYRPYDSTFEMLCQRLGLSKKKPYPPGSFNGLLSGK